LGRHRELLGKLHRKDMVEENGMKKEDWYTVTDSAFCKMRNLTVCCCSHSALSWATQIKGIRFTSKGHVTGWTEVCLTMCKSCGF
jgi:hypothetical protein